jgi:hypothetical protein
MMTATARIAKAIQPHCVLDSSFCDAAAAAATAGLTPDVVVAPELVVVAGGGDTATTVVVWDSVTVGVDRVGAVAVGVDRVGVVTEDVASASLLSRRSYASRLRAIPAPARSKRCNRERRNYRCGTTAI